MLEISELKAKKLPELQEIAKSLDVPKVRSFRKLDLIYKILDYQADNPKKTQEALADTTSKEKADKRPAKPKQKQPQKTTKPAARAKKATAKPDRKSKPKTASGKATDKQSGKKPATPSKKEDPRSQLNQSKQHKLQKRRMLRKEML